MDDPELSVQADPDPTWHTFGCLNDILKPTLYGSEK